MKNKNWFEVDKNGLKELQEGKDKTFVVRELLQNAFDENISECTLVFNYDNYSQVTISVSDNNPTGFKDLSDSFTLYRSTYKRKDVTKRGRFNFGEKQVFALCSSAMIKTTTGTIIFDINGRRMQREKTNVGSVITIKLRMTKEEMNECYKYASEILVPKNISFVAINKSENTERKVEYKEPHKIFQTVLTTETELNGAFRKTKRKTYVHLHLPTGKAFLYEMGLPVCEIDCNYSIDVQQKVPLSNDRDSVQQGFLKDLYAEVLNVTFNEIENKDASAIWVREATASERVGKEACQTIINKRFGEKALIFNPHDPIANDDAKANGYELVHGNHMSKEEWGNVKRYDLLPTTSALFGRTLVNARNVIPTVTQFQVGEFAAKVAKRFLGINITVEFLSAPDATNIADFELGGTKLRFNVPLISSWVEGDYVSKYMVDLIIHELGHHKGMHTQESYHQCLTMLGSELVHTALKEPEFFLIK